MSLLVNLRINLGTFPKQIRVPIENMILWFKDLILPRPSWNTRQNLLKWSEDFSKAEWLKFSLGTGSAPIVTVNQATAPNGTLTADKVVFDLNGGTTTGDISSLEQTLGGLSTVDYTGTVYLKGEIGGEQLAFRTVTGGYIQITLTTEWQRFELTAAYVDSTRYFTIAARAGLGFLVSDTATVYIWGAQLNEGSTASDYVKAEAEPYSFPAGTAQLNDYSNSNNGGVIHSGGALSFTTNDYAETDVSLNGLTSFSISSWVNFDASAANVVFSQGDSAGSSIYGGKFLGGNAAYLALNNVFANFGDISAYFGQEHLYTWAYDGTTAYFYIDGILFNSVVLAYTPINTTAQLSLGYQDYGATAYLAGDLADFKIYNRALSATEVLQNYNNPQAPIQDGLQVWYDFNELSGLTLFDRVNGNNASIVGATWESGASVGYQPALGGFNNYDLFDGSTNYVDIGTNIFNGLDAFDVTFGVQVSDYSNTPFLLSCGTNASNGIHWYINNSEQELRININGTTYDVNYSLFEGEKFTGRFVLNSGNLYWYKNGVLIGTSTSVPTIVASGSNTRIAAPSYAVAALFTGIIDYVEVEGVGRWSNLGSWKDEIGSNDGTPVGTFEKARIAGEAYNSTTDVFSNTILNPFTRGALNFSGGFSGCYVDAGSAVDTSGAFSFAGWVYVNDTNSSQYIYDNRITDEGQYLSLIDNGARFDLSFVNEDSGGTVVSVQSAAQNYGQWYFIAMTKGASGATTNLWWGDKNTAPANKTDVVNKDTGTAGAGTYNLHIASRASKTFPLNGYLSSQLMYTEDLSAANTDLTKIEEIWKATRNFLPN